MTVFGPWGLEFLWSLELGSWSFQMPQLRNDWKYRTFEQAQIYERNQVAGLEYILPTAQ
jgi:hypothetical protein